MGSIPSYEVLLKELESLKKELHETRKTTDILQNNEMHYRSFIENATEGFMLLNPERIIEDVNTRLMQISGYRRDEIIGRTLEAFYERTTVNFYSASQNHFNFEAMFRAKSDQMIPMLFNRSVLRDNKGKFTGYMCLLTDFTELRAAQAEERKAEQQYRSMYDHALQGMFQSEVSGKLIRVNPSFARIMGYASSEDLLSVKEGATKLFFNPEDRMKVLRAIERKGSVTNYELRLKRKDGKPVWILANIRLVSEDTERTILEGIMVDNTKKKKLEKKLKEGHEKFRKLSVLDNLTGLYNTRFLYQRLDALILESESTDKPFSLIFMDMDNFKKVVDTHGHLNGSQALREVAQTIKAAIVEPCFGVAYGGDEFVIVLPGFNKDEARQKADTIRNQMKQTRYLTEKGLAVHLSASFGLANFPDDTDNRTGLLALADKAMFRVKQDGKDAVGMTD